MNDDALHEAAAQMTVDIKQESLEDIREEVVSLFWMNDRWRLPTIEDCYQLWDWRYTALSDGETWAWAARDRANKRLVGHIAVHLRHFRIGDCLRRVGVPGNFYLHQDYRNSLIGPRMASLPRSLAKRGDVDLVIAFGNDAAHKMFSRLGFRDLGKMGKYVDIRRIGPILARRWPLARAIRPVLDALYAPYRRIRRYPEPGKGLPPLDVRKLSGEEFIRCDRRHWRAPDDRLVCAGSPGYLTRRFLEHPSIRRSVFGLFLKNSERLEGYVVMEGDGGVKVWDCQTNADTMDPVSAIGVVSGSLPEIDMVIVPAIERSQLSLDLKRDGYVQVGKADFIEARTTISAYWTDSHPAAERLQDTNRWNIWFGVNHY